MKGIADGIRAVIQGLEILADVFEDMEVTTTTTIETEISVETEPETADEPPQETESAQEETPEETPPKTRNSRKPKDTPPTEDDVRKLLSGKAQAGFTDEVKALLAKYGTTMISKLEEKHYAAVMQEAEGIK
jgi:hypothetical protein